MDIFEKIFQKISQGEIFRKRQSPGVLRVQDLSKYLDTFANTLANDSYQIQSLASRDFVGLHGGRMFLPEKIDYFEDPRLNRKLYQNLILQIMGAHHLKLSSSQTGDPSTAQRLHFLSHSNAINVCLDSLFPQYLTFQAELFGHVRGLAKFANDYQKQIFQYWQETALARAQKTIAIDKLLQSSRSQDVVPKFLYVAVPCLERFQLRNQELDLSHQEIRPKTNSVETEVEKTYSGLNEEVDLQKEKANPVMHSFEKLETADEYSGGRTMDSGDDDLSEDSKALDELNLTKMTRGGEAAKSVFNAEASIEFNFLQSEHKKDSSLGFAYPEWHFKKNRYMKNHCFLVQDPLDIPLGSNDFRQELLAKNRFQIKHWQSKIQSLFSEPLWQKKLFEGDEIDIDEVIRDLGARLTRQTVSARWYMSQKKQLNDVEIVFLFDQSHSSDSWIKNRRVLDICLEAVGTAGLLFDRIFETVTVAGIWSATRHNCSFQIYKNRLEPWSTFYRKKDAVQAQGYTRLGPAIRHATSLLKTSRKKKKLIILLTDGKPTDVDGYEGPVGIGDVRQACREAEVEGILHYAMILDHTKKAHFARMFKHHVLLHDPKFVSEELFKILFRLLKG